LTRALVAEPYSSDQVRMGALQAILYSVNRVPRAGRLAHERRWRHEEAMRRIGTTTRGYLQLWAMNWADWAPRWGSLQVTCWYFGPNQS